ncbi:lipopolysaccharide biosynthesis protein [Oryzobacter sp. R7]|uniref:lipopolysaccharide biosynthesis protein n=1 Tax=Oryzobacter faecalis TaxID=3388656 RepID=UPI00398CBC6B
MSGLLSSMFRPVRLDGTGATSIARGSVLSTTGLVAQGLLRFLTAFLVGRLAGRAELGVVATAIAAATLLALLWPTTAGSAASKYLARARGADRPEEVRSSAAHLARRTAQTAVPLGVAGALVWVLVDHGSWAGGVCVAALTVAYAGYSFTRGVQFGVAQVPRATAWDLASVAVGLVALLALLLAGVRGPVLVLPLVLAYGLYATAGWPWGARGRPDAATRREIDVFVALGATGTVASTGFLQLSQITAKVTSGDADAGQYAAALNLATPASMLAASLSLVLFPSMAEAWGRGDHSTFHARTDRATRALAVVMVAIFGSIAIASRLLVDVVWGEQFEGAVAVLPVLAVAILATNLGVASVNALTTRSARGMWVTTGASLAGLVVGTAAWALLAPSLGILGVALGYLCGTVVIAAVPVAVTWRQDGHAWGPVFARVLAGLVLVAAVIAVEYATGVSPWVDPLFVLGFLGAWWLVCRRDAADVLALLPWSRRPRDGA